MITEKTLIQLNAELHIRQIEFNAAARNLEHIKARVVKAESGEHATKKARITELREVLKTVTPDVWLSKLLLIKDHDIRVRAAQIIWWDFFGNVPVDKRTYKFDGYLEEYRKLESPIDAMERSVFMLSEQLKAANGHLTSAKDKQTKAVAAALAGVGYGKELAKMRMYGEQEETEVAE